jgi:microcystin-dependent protein
VSTPFLGELRIFPYNFAPKGWAMANGQLLPISQNTALFSLLGTTYGGNGTTTFALPNLQGSIPIGAGSGYTQGQTGGEQSHTLTVQEMPTHNHPLAGSSVTATTNTPVSNVLATGSGVTPYGSGPANTTMSSTALSSVGNGQAHENRQPFLVLTVCIALLGIFPSRN